MFDVKKYKPAGPTLKAFHESSAFFRGVAGPVGSGKTAGAGCVEMALGGMLQNPFPDGRRKAKFGILRDTYRNLYSQFLPSWFEWFPKGCGGEKDFVGSDDRPAMHTFSLEGCPILGPNGRVVGYGPVDLQIEMRALGADMNVEKTMRGWNLTGLFADEADLMPETLFDIAPGRVKRWPEKPYRVSKGVWFTFNKPDVDHFLYRRLVEEIDDNSDWAFFDQPSGLLPGSMTTNPDAENLERLDEDYYQTQARSMPEWLSNRMVRNQWGASIAGEVVYGTFRRDRHVCRAELEPEPGAVLTLGLDGGGTPAAVIGGRTPTGRRMVYAEVVLFDPSDPKRQRLLTGCGPKRFAQAIGDVLTSRFRSCAVTIGWGDPAAFFGADREFGEASFMETVGQILGIAIQPAPSNEIYLRQGAVTELLDRANLHDAGADLWINPSCRWLIRGFSSDYKWTARDPKQPGAELKPQKTATSHVHDALQYFALGDVGRAGVTSGRSADRYAPKRAVNPETGQALWMPQSFVDRRREQARAAPGGSYSSDFDPWA